MKRFLVVFISIMIMVALSLGNITVTFSAQAKIIPGGQYNLTDYQKFSGRKITSFNEAPQLKELVQQGKLPPVEKRIPQNPPVVQPIERVGKYGGVWRRYSPIAWYGVHFLISYEPLVRICGPDLTKIEPNIAERWNLSKDAKTLVLYLRKGIRWSDGEPFTADDIMFWYEDIILNKELTPTPPTWLITGGEIAKFKKIDDYTIEMNFSQPYPLILYELAANKNPYAPKHYLKQFHLKYTAKEKLEAMTKEAGLQFWYQLFARKNDATMNTELPTIWAWRTTIPWGADGLKVERNPYYWKIDPEGNQLPYIDTIRVYYVSDWSMGFLKIMAGEGEMQGVGFKLMDYDLYMANREKGGYKVVKWTGLYPGEPTIMFNQTVKDPVLRKIFRDVRFRQAMSLAINRKEINQALYFGLCEPLQPTIVPPSPLYKEEFAKVFAEYNPKKAEELLDKIGLKRGPDGWRMRPDGKRLELTLDTRQPLQWIDVANMVAKYWNDIGVKTAVRVDEIGTLWATRVNANEHEVVTQGFSTNPLLIGISAFNMTAWTAWAGEWARWYQTGGRAGEKPEGDALKVIELWEQYKTTIDPIKRINLGREILRLHAKNLWIIGAGGRKLPYIFLVKSNFHNWPEDWIQDLSYGSQARAHPEQCFIEQ